MGADSCYQKDSFVFKPDAEVPPRICDMECKLGQFSIFAGVITTVPRVIVSFLVHLYLVSVAIKIF